jgi:hypothetical protein
MIDARAKETFVDWVERGAPARWCGDAPTSR